MSLPRQKRRRIRFSKLLNFHRFGSVKTEERISFTKNLSAMLSAGLTLSRALSVIERQTHNKLLKAIVTDLEEEVKKGSSFHEALAQAPESILETLHRYDQGGRGVRHHRGFAQDSGAPDGPFIYAHEKSAWRDDLSLPSSCRHRGHRRLMLMYVVPTLSSTSNRSAWSSRLRHASSSRVGFHGHNVIIVFVVLAAFFGGMFAFIKSKLGSAHSYGGARMPVIGDLVRETFAARAARSLASLLSSGVEMLTAIGIT
jgi:type II secretory pathway component PulF